MKSSSLKTDNNTYMHEPRNIRLRFLSIGKNQLPRTEYYFLAAISFILFMNMPLNTDGSILNKNLKSSLISSLNRSITYFTYASFSKNSNIAYLNAVHPGFTPKLGRLTLIYLNISASSNLTTNGSSVQKKPFYPSALVMTFATSFSSLDRFCSGLDF